MQVQDQARSSFVLFVNGITLGLLERRRDKTRAIKQGMLQQLPTGRVRLVGSEGSVAPCADGELR